MAGRWRCGLLERRDRRERAAERRIDQTHRIGDEAADVVDVCLREAALGVARGLDAAERGGERGEHRRADEGIDAEELAERGVELAGAGRVARLELHEERRDLIEGWRGHERRWGGSSSAGRRVSVPQCRPVAPRE